MALCLPKYAAWQADRVKLQLGIKIAIVRNSLLLGLYGDFGL